MSKKTRFFALLASVLFITATSSCNKTEQYKYDEHQDQKQIAEEQVKQEKVEQPIL